MQDSWDIQGRPLWWKCVLGCVRLFVTPQTVACLASFSKEFSRQEYWSGLTLLGSFQPRDRMRIFFIGRWVLYSWATPEAGSTFRDMDKFPSFSEYHKENSEKKIINCLGSVNKINPVFYDCLLQKALPSLASPPSSPPSSFLQAFPPRHGFKTCSGEERSEDMSFYCIEKAPILQVITFTL